LTIIYYRFLPENITTNYIRLGQANSCGGKVNILILPLIATVIFIRFTILSKFIGISYQKNFYTSSIPQLT